ncbi:MAG: peptide chain release factor N(5)-glutamine methyltransferase [Alphaproteobacteria bacterium]|nr:peptide chain release factor N(5)-glutamine methyltransferase [Alphaproteobacteria bacterium]
MPDIFTQTINNLSIIGISSPRLEARMIFAFLLDQSQDAVGTNSTLSPQQQELLAKIIKRRKDHEPLDKILGYRDFYKYSFAVDCNVLSPRPDSEILVEEAIKLAKEEKTTSILEFGVGSGCLILSILSDCPQLRGVGIDKSTKAIEIAKKNAEQLNLLPRITLKQGDYFSPLDISEKFSLIISNPPYISSGDIAALDLEVKNFDPLMALDGGPDGLCHYRQIAVVAKPLLQDGGHILLEVGQGQADDVCNIFDRQGFADKKIVCDLAGIQRCIIFKK